MAMECLTACLHPYKIIFGNFFFTGRKKFYPFQWKTLLHRGKSAIHQIMKERAHREASDFFRGDTVS